MYASRSIQGLGLAELSRMTVNLHARSRTAHFISFSRHARETVTPEGGHLSLGLRYAG